MTTRTLGPPHRKPVTTVGDKRRRNRWLREMLVLAIAVMVAMVIVGLVRGVGAPNYAADAVEDR